MSHVPAKMSVVANDVGATKLPELIEGFILELGFYPHADIDAIRDALGLPEPITEETSEEERGRRLAEAAREADTVTLARRVLELGPTYVDTKTLFDIQDALWTDQGFPQIPKRTRHEMVRDLEISSQVHTPTHFMALLESLWLLETEAELIAAASKGERAKGKVRLEIERNVLHRPVPGIAQHLFKLVGAFDASDRRYALFLEGLIAPDLLPHEPLRRRAVEIMNSHLRPIGAELRETGAEDGYAVFNVVSLHGPHGRPRNIVFASLNKPDIRIPDVIANTVEIVGNTEDVLVYDRPIGVYGVRWRDLQQWWKETRNISSDEEAKTSLYQRLATSLPRNSPPQNNLYRLYHEIHGTAVHDLPALLPEVWLHWDPKTIRERGPQALLRFRMDFLLLLPHGHRIVIEVDGDHHYTGSNGFSSPAKYGNTVRGDRDLKLAGYEVFRFGGAELNRPEAARAVLQQFFSDLFRRYSVHPAN